MRFFLTDDTWGFEEIHEAEWFMIMQLPQAADVRQSDKGRKRLFPDPATSDGTDEESEELSADWKEFIQPDLESQFARDVETISGDLGTAEEEEDDEGNVEYFLSIPMEHAETWYSVLNQARLIINEEHDIAGTERSFFLGGQSPSEIGKERWLTMMQYRVYGAIQEFILSQIMEPGYEGE